VEEEAKSGGWATGKLENASKRREAVWRRTRSGRAGSGGGRES